MGIDWHSYFYDDFPGEFAEFYLAHAATTRGARCPECGNSIYANPRPPRDTPGENDYLGLIVFPMPRVAASDRPRTFPPRCPECNEPLDRPVDISGLKATEIGSPQFRYSWYTLALIDQTLLADFPRNARQWAKATNIYPRPTAEGTFGFKTTAPPASLVDPNADPEELWESGAAFFVAESQKNLERMSGVTPNAFFTAVDWKMAVKGRPDPFAEVLLKKARKEIGFKAHPKAELSRDIDEKVAFARKLIAKFAEKKLPKLVLGGSLSLALTFGPDWRKHVGVKDLDFNLMGDPRPQLDGIFAALEEAGCRIVKGKTLRGARIEAQTMILGRKTSIDLFVLNSDTRDDDGVLGRLNRRALDALITYGQGRLVKAGPKGAQIDALPPEAVLVYKMIYFRATDQRHVAMLKGTKSANRAGQVRGWLEFVQARLPQLMNDPSLAMDLAARLAFLGRPLSLIPRDATATPVPARARAATP